MVVWTSNRNVKDRQFINHLTGKVETRNARNLKSDTKDVTPYVIYRDNLRIVLVDTPGFDDTYRSDAEILRVIANWLTQRYVAIYIF